MAAPEILTVPPVEAVEHFRAKGYHVGFDWRDTSAAQHLSSFTVAKAMQLDILEDIREAVDEAIAEGITFRQFQQRLEPILRRKGWWGQQEMVDPLTGERRLVQLGSPRRLRTIFDTNIRMATAHGRWERVQRLKGAMPYLRYVAVLDARTRPEHALWHGTTLPVDHPWWRTHYPPNGWHCRCIVVQLSDDDLGRYGYSVSPDPSVRTREWLNRRTGQTVQVPLGIDPGFAHNVGSLDPVRAAVRVAEAKHGAGSIVPRAPAAPKTWREYAIIGREVVQELRDQAGPPEAAGFSEAFRAGLLARLRDRIGGADADIRSATGGRVSVQAATRTREAVEAFIPASWVRAGNARHVEVRGRNGFVGGWCRPSGSVRQDDGTRRFTSSEMSVDADVATSVHEYIHHLQFALGYERGRRVGRFHETWDEFYRYRTTLDDGSGRLEALVGSKYGSRYRVRKDKWYDDYMGEESGLELAARVFEILSHGLNRRQVIGKLLLHDPELVNFAIGFMLRFDP